MQPLDWILYCRNLSTLDVFPQESRDLATAWDHARFSYDSLLREPGSADRCEHEPVCTQCQLTLWPELLSPTAGEATPR